MSTRSFSKVAAHNVQFNNQYPDNNLKFQHQNDQVFLWISTWSNQQVCNVILECMKNCSYQSKICLSTLIEPLFHGDFIYHKFNTNGNFAYPSTFISREIKKNLAKDVNNTRKRQQVKVCQLKSMHITSEDDIKTWSNNSILPNIKTFKESNEVADSLESFSFLPAIKTSYTYPMTSLSDKESQTETKNLQQSSKVLHNDSQRQILKSYNDVKKKENRLLFQSPSRCTFRRNRMQIHPSVKSAPAAISCRSLPVLNKSHILSKTDTPVDNIFEKRLVGMEITRRHLQTVEKERRQNELVPKSLSDFCLRRKAFLQGEEKDFEKQKIQFSYFFSQWTEWQKEEFLKNLLVMLNPGQLYFLYASIMVSIYRDFVALLPEKIVFKIFGYLHPKYLKQCTKVSKTWKWYSEHDHLWGKICRRKDIEIEGRTYMEKYSSYESIKNNWMEGRFNLFNIQASHESAICLDVLDDMIVAGIADKSIRIWKKSDKDVKLLYGHQKTIWSVKFVSNTLLLSCSSDHTVKIWNIKTGKCVRTIVGHDGAVWCLDTKGEIFATGSADKTAKVWDLRSSHMVCSFLNHPGGVYAVCFDEYGEKLFTGSIEKTLKLWDINDITCLLSIQIGNNKTPMAPITSLAYHKGYLACVCGTDFQIYDSVSQQLLDTYKECHKDRIESVKLKVKIKRDEYNFSEEVKFKLLTSGKDGKVKAWEKSRKKALLVFTIADEVSIFDFIFDDTKIICATTNGVKKLDFNVKSEIENRRVRSNSNRSPYKL